MNMRTYFADISGQTTPELAQWRLTLYVAGQSPKSLQAFQNLVAICNRHIHGAYFLEIVDLLEDPRLAKADQIFAIPTLVRHVPIPVVKVIGDLSNTERVLAALNLPALTLVAGGTRHIVGMASRCTGDPS